MLCQDWAAHHTHTSPECPISLAHFLLHCSGAKKAQTPLSGCRMRWSVHTYAGGKHLPPPACASVSQLGKLPDSSLRVSSWCETSMWLGPLCLIITSSLGHGKTATPGEELSFVKPGSLLWLMNTSFGSLNEKNTNTRWKYRPLFPKPTQHFCFLNKHKRFTVLFACYKTTEKGLCPDILYLLLGSAILIENLIHSFAWREIQ